MCLSCQQLKDKGADYDIKWKQAAALQHKNRLLCNWEKYK